MKDILRPYQVEAQKNAGDLLRSGLSKIITVLPTGAGKTILFINTCYKIMRSGKKVAVVMRRRELIFQTADKFEKFTGYKPSIIMGSEKGFDPSKNIQVMSIDTICRRIKKEEYAFLLDFEYLVVDECHDTTSPKYKNFLQLFMDKIWLGYTATCFPTGNRYLQDIGWQETLSPISSAELRDDGFLVQDIVYAPAKIDTSDIKTVKGDYDQKTLAQRASESKVVGDIVDTWKKYGEDRPTLMFAVNKEHSKILSEAFRQAGIPALHQDESHTSKERKDAINQLTKGEIKILSSIGIFSTGTDIPQAGCGIFARPTKSEILYVQQVGRVLRPYKKCARCKADCGAEQECFRCGSNHFTDIKSDAIILDHANNCERFGLAFDPRAARIRPVKEKKKKSDEVDIPKTKTCAGCFAVYPFNHLECPLCGHVNETKKRMIEHEEGELKRIQAAQLNISRYKQTLDKYYRIELRANLKDSFKYFKLYEEHGDDIFEYSKELGLPGWLKGIVRKKALQGNIKKPSN